jgi:hypothetical protein
MSYVRYPPQFIDVSVVVIGAVTAIQERKRISTLISLMTDVAEIRCKGCALNAVKYFRSIKVFFCWCKGNYIWAFVVKPYDSLQVKNASYFVSEYSICYLVPCETLSCEVRAVSEETVDNQIIQFIGAKVYEISFMVNGEFC